MTSPFTWDGLHTTQDPGGAIQNTLNPEEEGPWTNASDRRHFSSNKRRSSMSGPLQNKKKQKKNPISSNDGLRTTQDPGGAIQNMPNAEEEGPWTNVSVPLWSNDTRTGSSSDALHTWAGIHSADPDTIRNILDQEEPWTNVSDLRQDLAQDVVNFLHSELDGVFAEDTEYRTVCTKCLHALSFAYAVLPSNLYLPRTALIQRQNRNSRSSGNNYMHYRALIRGPRLVCLTRFRPSHGSESDKDDKGIMLAALTWHQLRHDNILPLYGFSTEIFPETFCFVSPWMWRGNALDYLRVNPGHDRRGWVRDIAAAMKYLHTLNPCVIHGAIKAENILIRDDLRCYLSGFWERRLDLSHLEGGNFTTNERANDVYLFGLTIIELYTGQRKVLDSAPEIPAHLWYQVILPCLNEVSDRRPSADAIVNMLYRHSRQHLWDYEAGKHAPVGDQLLLPAPDPWIDSSFYSNGILMQLGPAAYNRPKLSGTTSKLLQERLKQLQPWKDIEGWEGWAHDHGLDVQSVMDGLQLELDQVTTEDSEHRRKCIKCVRELSRQHGILPSQLCIPEASFEMFDNTRLGGGGFSDIHKGRIMGQPVCVKSLRIHQTGGHSLEHMKKVLCHEALIWQQAPHENILPFYGVSVDIILQGLCFISPWMVHGNVRQYLDAHPSHDPLGWVWDVATAIQYLHSLDPCIIHKDMRAVNILVGDNLRAYVSDFGISLVVETRLPGTNTRTAGNVRWLPPELINVSEGSRDVMKEWDIYSFGCMVLEMYTRQDPYSELRNDAAVIYHVSQKKLPRQPLPKILPASLWESVVVPCLSSEPSERPSADAILGILKSRDSSPIIHKYLSRKRRAAELTFRKSDIVLDEQFRPGGISSDICRATLVIDNRRHTVCLKRLRICGSQTDFDSAVKAFTQEAFIWRRLRHENILPFYGMSEEVMEYPSLCLISPWMEDGNIRDFLVNNPDHDRLRMIWDIASGIQYLHGLDPRIIHKDIRGPNILVGPQPHHRCYLADFGISIVAETTVNRVAGNARWTAPELLKPNHDAQLLCFADIYSFGCTVLEIYTGQQPYSDVLDAHITYYLLQGTLPKRPEQDILPSKLWDKIVLPCLSHSPQERPSATNILKTLEEFTEPSLVEYIEMIKTGGAAEEGCIRAARSALPTESDTSGDVDLVEEK